MSTRQNSLGFLTLGSEAAHGSGVVLYFNASLLFEGIHAVFYKDVIKVFTTKMSVAIGSLDLKDTILDRQK